MTLAIIETTVIGYDDAGTGLPIVLIHGHPFNRTMWQNQQQALGAIHRVIAPDLRGYGESAPASEKTSLGEFASDIARLLDRLGVDSVVLGGLSMGGQIVLEFYQLFPGRVRALILADTFAQADTEEGRRSRYAMAERLLRDGMAGYAEEVLPKMMTPANIERLPESAARVLAMMKGTDPKGAAAALRGRAERRDYTKLLAEISVPCLIIVGSEDVFTPVADAEYMRARIPGSRLAVIDGAGHMPNIERPQEFNRVVLQFLEDLHDPQMNIDA